MRPELAPLPSLAAALPRGPLMPVAGALGRYSLPGGLAVLVVSDTLQLTWALAQLRGAMADRFVAITMEWRKDGGGRAPVGVLQLASASLCLVLQVQHVAFAPPLQQFLW